MTRIPSPRGLAFGGLVAMLVGLSGCTLIAKVDRDKNPNGASPEDSGVDATTDGPSTSDGHADGPGPDANDGATTEDANDGSTTEDANDGAPEEDANDAGEDAN